MKTKRHTKIVLTLAMLTGLLFADALPAAALEVNVSGQMVFQWGFRDGYDNYGDYFDNEAYDTSSDHFFARQRARIQTEFIASENLRGVLQLQFGTTNWGDSGTGGQLDTTTETGKVRRAYIDWNVADTTLNVKMGLQEIALPSAVAGNPILDSHVAAIAVGAGLTDEITLTGFWARPYHDTNLSGWHEYKNNTMDMFGLVADFNYESVVFQPYIMYSRIGDWAGFNTVGSGYITHDNYSDYYLAGLALQVKPVERLTLGLDALYNYVKNQGDPYHDPITGRDEKYFDKTSAWFVAFGADYALDFGTLGMVAWYATGDDYDDFNRDKREFGTIHSISTNVSGFAPTRLAFQGAYAIGDDGLLSTTGAGTWGVGVHLKDFSFVEDLSHTVRLVYFQGTDDKKFADNYISITTKDKAFEIDFDTTYQIAKGFKAIAEMAYVRLDMEDKVADIYEPRNHLWNVQLTLEYSF